jgi:hypothetical protein
MADIDGSWNCIVKSPLGDQEMTLTVTTEGDRFTGSGGGQMGAMDIEGDVSGNTISWKMSISSPMPMTLDCEATADGDTLTGSVGAGAFGSFPLSGTRAN